MKMEHYEIFYLTDSFVVENRIFPRVASSKLLEGSQPIDWYQRVIV